MQLVTCKTLTFPCFNLLAVPVEIKWGVMEGAVTTWQVSPVDGPLKYT